MIIPKELDYLLSLQKRKDAKIRIKKVYNALIYKKGNNKGYFNCPSAYLLKASPRYNLVINLLIEHKIIEFQSFNYDTSDLFNQSYQTMRRKKYYNTENGTCIRYRFLIDIEDGYEDNELEIDFTKIYEKEKWYSKTRYSLLQLGFQPEDLIIKRDNFSRRLHTNITGNINGKSYKDLLAGGDYCTIDAKTFHPRLLWMVLKEREQNDENLSYIFENELDFYDYILEKVPSILRTNNEMIESLKMDDDYIYDEENIKNDERKIAKEAFMSWINGTGYMDEDIRPLTRLFPILNNFIRGYKSSSYKDMARFLQYKESTIFIDDLLNNSPFNFTLTVHDSLVIKKEDAEKALDYCKNKYPDLVFVLEEIKRN